MASRPYRQRTESAALEAAPSDAYRAIVIAVLQRAVSDACGQGQMRGDERLPADRTQREARSWLLGRGAEELLALAGYDADPVLRQVRRVLEG